ACAHELAEALHAGSSRKAVILPRALGDEIQAVVHGGPCLRADLTIDREKVILLVALHGSVGLLAEVTIHSDTAAGAPVVGDLLDSDDQAAFGAAQHGAVISP